LLKLSKDEFIHTMNYLNDLGIIVRGEDSFLDGEFENYQYIVPKKGKGVLGKSVLEQDEARMRIKKMDMYQKEKTLSLRNELVLLHRKLVKKIACDYMWKSGISADELEGYGYEGLICAIENYDPNKGGGFYNYASSFIRGYILRGIANYSGYYRRQTQLYWLYLSYKRVLEYKCQSNLDLEPEWMLEKIMDSMVCSQDISESCRLEYKNLFLLNEKDLVQTGIYFGDFEESETMDKMVFSKFLSQDLNERLQKLDKRDREIIEKRFGLNGKEFCSLEQLGREYHISREAVRLSESRTLKKLKVRELKDYLYL